MHPEHRSIGELAYHLWQARGCPEGSAEQDWLDAEKQLRASLRGVEPRAMPTKSDATGRTLPASDPPAGRAPRTNAPVVPARSKSTQGKPSPNAPR